MTDKFAVERWERQRNKVVHRRWRDMERGGTMLMSVVRSATLEHVWA